ncbi:hypothetical protein B0H13DRAFT_1871612 [Mycena leptocephala]|nr:hypothetical protein B0H13DRAFT_1871612 [Mycena leptocephala]
MPPEGIEPTSPQYRRVTDLIMCGDFHGLQGLISLPPGPEAMIQPLPFTVHSAPWREQINIQAPLVPLTGPWNCNCWLVASYRNIPRIQDTDNISAAPYNRLNSFPAPETFATGYAIATQTSNLNH